MFTKHNSLFIPTTLVNAMQQTAATIAAFTHIAPTVAPANAPTVAPANAPTIATPNRTAYMFACVQAGLSNTQAVQAVQARYGNVPTNAASISWCRQAIKQHAAGKTTAQAKVAARMLAKIS